MTHAYTLRTSLPRLFEQSDRPVGWHVSDVINDYFGETGKFQRRDFEFTEWMRLGMGLEAAIATAMRQEWPERYPEVPKLVLDGIHMTPDLLDTAPYLDSKLEELYGVTVDESDECIDEIKLTGYWDTSDGTGDPWSAKYETYLMQLKSYCWGRKTRLGRLWVCHVDGDGSRPRISRPYLYEYLFDEADLITNWALIKSWQARMIAEGRTPEHAKGI